MDGYQKQKLANRIGHLKNGISVVLEIFAKNYQ